MKKLYLMILAAVVVLQVTAQTPVKKWQGASSDNWDNVSANWVPLVGLPFPTTFNQGDDVLLDDSRNEGKDTLFVVDEIQAANITFKNSAAKPYVIRQASTASKITGAGALYKENDGEVIVGVNATMEGGVVAKGGWYSADDPGNSVNPFGTKVTFRGGGIRTHYRAVDSPTYSNSCNFEVPAGETGLIYVPRRISLKGDFTGSGTLTVQATGERIFADLKSADLSGFDGTLRIEKSKPTAYTPGLYGLGFITDSTYTAELNTETGEVSEKGINNMLAKVKYHLGLNTALYSESGTRCYRIGELTADDSCAIHGYYKSSTTPVTYWRVGSLNTDVVLPACIRPQASDAANMPRRDNKVGFIKEGTGTYTLTNGSNFITAGIQVVGGKLFISNPAGTESGTGYHMSWGSMVLVYKDGTLGGTGRISGNVEVYGTLAPGENGIGTLTIGDLYSLLDSSVRRPFELILRPTATLELELSTAASHDKLVTDSIRTGGTLKVALAPTYDVKAGDTFKILEGVPSSKSVGFSSVIMPKTGEGWTWDTSKLLTDGTVTLLTGGGAAVSSELRSLESRIRLWPNPNAGVFNLSLPEEKELSVGIVNAAGVTVYRQKVSASRLQINPGPLADGLYFVTVGTREGQVVKKMIVKN